MPEKLLNIGLTAITHMLTVFFLNNKVLTANLSLSLSLSLFDGSVVILCQKLKLTYMANLIHFSDTQITLTQYINMLSLSLALS